MNFHISQCLVVEEETREQSKSRQWFDQRAGRVTASVFKEAARAERAVSLIKRICYPLDHSRFSNEATRYRILPSLRFGIVHAHDGALQRRDTVATSGKSV